MTFKGVAWCNQNLNQNLFFSVKLTITWALCLIDLKFSKLVYNKDLKITSDLQARKSFLFNFSCDQFEKLQLPEHYL